MALLLDKLSFYPVKVSGHKKFEKVYSEHVLARERLEVFKLNFQSYSLFHDFLQFLVELRVKASQSSIAFFVCPYCHPNVPLISAHLSAKVKNIKRVRFILQCNHQSTFE